MRHFRTPARYALAVTLLSSALASGCGEEAREVEPSVVAQWEAARRLWHIDREWTTAWAAWMAIDPGTAQGREARRLLEEADPHYRMMITEVHEGDEGAPETWEYAARIAPMDPDLYLPLARAYRARSRVEPENRHLFIGAEEFYRKFLALRPQSDEAPQARRELAEFDPTGTLPDLSLSEPPWLPPEGELDPPTEPPGWPLAVAVAALLLALLAVTLLFLRGRTQLVPLETLVARKPELHPAIAYLVGSLRHELLKHRIGAVVNAVDALGRGRATLDQMEFLEHRLYGGEPLTEAWDGFLRAFERALGPELDLVRTDKHFARAGRAIHRIAALEPRVKKGDKGAIVKLEAAYEELRTLDRYLSSMVHRLVRTPVDGALFREVVDEIRTEYTASQVKLDEVVIRAPEPAPMVEVFRVDLVLILKNVVRNAILAVGEAEAPRRIGLDVSCEVELTGEEAVRIHVRDTSPDLFTTEDIYARRMDRGLGLVTAALGRYDGVISVERGDGEWEKAVVVRFFRAYEDDELEVEHKDAA